MLKRLQARADCLQLRIKPSLSPWRPQLQGWVTVDQMVGPWPVPVADCAVTAASFDTYAGEAMSLGERTPLAFLDFGASARMAVAESIMNIAGTDIGSFNRIKLSANWMSAAGSPRCEDGSVMKQLKP